MAFRKKTAGQSIRYTAETWNRMVDAADYYERNQRLGEGGGNLENDWPTDCIKIKNSSGGDRTRGEVLKVGSALIDGITNGTLTEAHPRNFWYDGDQPDDADNVVCVLKTWIPSAGIGLAQVSGLAAVKVNIGNANHEYAIVKDSSYNLESSAGGGLPILFKPSGTGVKVCQVLLGKVNTGGFRWARTGGSGITARSGTTLGSGTVTLFENDGGTLTTTSQTVTCYNAAGAAVAADTYIMVAQDEKGQWGVLMEDCGA